MGSEAVRGHFAPTDQERYDLQRLRNRLTIEKADRCPFCGPNRISGCPGCRREVEYEVQRAEMDLREVRSKAVRQKRQPTVYDQVSEAQFQVSVLEWAAALGWMRHHVYDSRLAAKMCDPGFPDLVLVKPAFDLAPSRHLFAELKTEHGKLSPDQVVWLDALTAAGAECYVWRPSGMDEVVEILKGREGKRWESE